MMKTICLYFFLLTAFVAPAFCQSAKNNDPVKTAKKDAKHFKLDDATWKAYKQKHFDPASDHFKPRKENVSDTALLKDSVYVQTYRLQAYNKTQHRRTTGHYILVGGGIAAGLFALLIAAILIFIAPNMG